MLDAPRYLLGVAEILWLAGFAGLGATALRRRLVPGFTGAAALLATLVLALAFLILAAEALGSFGAFEALPYLLLVGATGVLSWRLLRRVAPVEGGRERTHGPPAAHPQPGSGPAGRNLDVLTVIALAIAAVAVIHFADGVRLRLDTGMTGFDSTWYHGPFAAGFFQSGDTWGLRFIAPQFLAWFYPANGELLHAVGMLAFGRDLLSPLLNLGWLLCCLLACWCIGRPARVAPWSLALGAVALSIPALADQAGEARNDVVGIFFLLAAVAVALNAWGSERGDKTTRSRAGLSAGALLLAGLCAGLAVGTKLNLLLPAAALLVGLSLIAPAGRRWGSLGFGTLGALAGGGYWYLRNLIHTGNPLPWFDHLGPVSLPAPSQELGGRETHSVLAYLTDWAVWSDWLLPGLHQGLWLVWPLLLALAAYGVAGNLGRRASPPARAAAVTALFAAIAWLIAPTSASGPDGMPTGFESGLRYLAPALVLGLTLLPVGLRPRFRETDAGQPPEGRILKMPLQLERHLSGRWLLGVGLATFAVLAVAAGYAVQREYLRDRYLHPTFAAAGLDSAFKWARSVSGARIATTSTRQYPLFGTDLSNQVEFVGERRPHGGFVAPASCRAWRSLLAAGDYDYVVASRDRIETGKPAYPPTARWTEGPGATVVLRRPPTVVFRLRGPLDPTLCPSRRTN